MSRIDEIKGRLEATVDMVTNDPLARDYLTEDEEDIAYLFDDREKREAYIKKLETAARDVLNEYDFSGGPFVGPLTELLYLKAVMEGRDE